jgi:hypothetical protein
VRTALMTASTYGDPCASGFPAFNNIAFEPDANGTPRTFADSSLVRVGACVSVSNEAPLSRSSASNDLCVRSSSAMSEPGTGVGVASGVAVFAGLDLAPPSGEPPTCWARCHAQRSSSRASWADICNVRCFSRRTSMILEPGVMYLAPKFVNLSDFGACCCLARLLDSHVAAKHAKIDV